MGKQNIDAMVEAELERQELNRKAGIVEVEGRITNNLSFWQMMSAVLVANLLTGVIGGFVALLVVAAS